MFSLVFQFFEKVLFSIFLIIVALQAIATEVQSESKWKQLGELAMSTGKVQLLACANYAVLIKYGFLS